MKRIVLYFKVIIIGTVIHLLDNIPHVDFEDNFVTIYILFDVGLTHFQVLLQMYYNYYYFWDCGMITLKNTFVAIHHALILLLYSLKFHPLALFLIHSLQYLTFDDVFKDL